VKFALALLIAVHFWGDRNVPIPCHPVAVMNADAELPPDPVWGERFNLRVPMATYARDCRILISHNAETTDRIVAPETYCMDVVHEVGHIAGLPHTPDGVMAAVTSLDDVPYYCRHVRAFRRTL
jgi:hypothetical protein